MKADPAAQALLIDLQAIDLDIDRNRHRLVVLPERDRVTALAARLRELNDERVVADTEIADLRRAVARADADVTSVRARSERDRSLLDSGSVAASKHLSDIEHELETLARRQRDLEDEELELMEAVENAENRLQEISNHLTATQSELEAAQQAQDAALVEIEDEHSALGAKQASVTEQIPADLLALYERIRAEGSPVAAAYVRGGRCEACQMELARADMSDLRSAPVDEVLRCPECRSIVVRAEPAA